MSTVTIQTKTTNSKSACLQSRDFFHSYATEEEIKDRKLEVIIAAVTRTRRSPGCPWEPARVWFSKHEWKNDERFRELEAAIGAARDVIFEWDMDDDQWDTPALKKLNVGERLEVGDIVYLTSSRHGRATKESGSAPAHHIKIARVTPTTAIGEDGQTWNRTITEYRWHRRGEAHRNVYESDECYRPVP